jgi:hypothetical protein
MTEEQSNQPLPPVKVAFVIDNKVVDILYTDERLASIFSSNPTVINITDFVEINVDDIYDPKTKSFRKPS